jgi:sarcosine oxidase subunit alpha
MTDLRISKHPILPISEFTYFDFFWDSKKCNAREGETIAAALMANGVMVFGHHPKDGAPQSFFCANGQCSQCMVIANGLPVKSCMELIQPGMNIKPLNGLPSLPKTISPGEPSIINEIETDVLIIGGGPAGLSAAIELGKLNLNVLLVDDKQKLGGKLVLQTHRFFGSVKMVYAGTRGIDIASKLENDLISYPSVEIWRNSVALAVFSDKKVGIIRNATEYFLIKPKVLLTASGAREKFLSFYGNTLPGVLGAGAFQTLVNRDLVRISKNLFIVGGGNVGLIAGYHALQAGIQISGLAEALPECGGYKVHKDKLERLGVPIFTSHTILSANGNSRVESVTIAALDSQFHSISGTEKTFSCDCVLVAVGLDPVDEFHHKAVEYGIPAYSAGDAEEIAEASAAIITGKIKGLGIAKYLGVSNISIPNDWIRSAEILKSKPGLTLPEKLDETESGILPIIHCSQEIPCDPCSRLCDQELIRIAIEDIRNIPRYIGAIDACKGCFKCLIGCPGLAITLVDFRKNPDFPIVSVPVEFGNSMFIPGNTATAVNTKGSLIGNFPIKALRGNKNSNGTWILQLEVPREYSKRIAGVRIQGENSLPDFEYFVENLCDEMIVCRCERISAGEIRELIRKGYTDINEIKTVLRAGMGSCGGKTCFSLIKRIFREEGFRIDVIVNSTPRPLFMEVTLSKFAGYHNG